MITIHLAPSILVFNAFAIVNNETLTILPSMADIKVPMEVIGRIIRKGMIIVSEELELELLLLSLFISIGVSLDLLVEFDELYSLRKTLLNFVSCFNEALSVYIS